MDIVRKPVMDYEKQLRFRPIGKLYFIAIFNAILFPFCHNTLILIPFFTYKRVNPQSEYYEMFCFLPKIYFLLMDIFIKSICCAIYNFLDFRIV